MQIAFLSIKNFRGIKETSLHFPNHTVLVGDNNAGKTTIFEALDLVLGPDRLTRQYPIDEHDFYNGIYLESIDLQASEYGSEATVGDSIVSVSDAHAGIDNAAKIEISAILTNLTLEQKNILGKNYIEFWDSKGKKLYKEPDPQGVDAKSISEAISVTFLGWYDKEEDDFIGKTYFTRSLTEEDIPVLFQKRHKQLCGFLYLRSLRTGTRALSLERGSLLDIILRLNDLRPQMWEKLLKALAELPVATDPELGISPILESIDAALKKYVPQEWGTKPHLKLSNFTREHLRKIITAFIATGNGAHSTPFYRQGTGTVNMLVLAMLSQIAHRKQNVIFAMEEPETAIPPYAQKRIVHEVRNLASQSLFTSHSPYVLEEFTIEETLILSGNKDGILSQKNILLPENIKPKRYRQDFRTRFCEGLLARRILVVEGATEASAFPAACRRLAELEPEKYQSLEALGVCVIDAGGQTFIPSIAQVYKQLGKQVFALCDKQDMTNAKNIASYVEQLYMHDEHGLENLTLTGTTEEALKAFAEQLDWPQHLTKYYKENDVTSSLRKYFEWGKGCCCIADFLALRTIEEIPEWIRKTALAIKIKCDGESNPNCSTDNIEQDINCPEGSQNEID